MKAPRLAVRESVMASGEAGFLPRLGGAKIYMALPGLAATTLREVSETRLFSPRAGRRLPWPSLDQAAAALSSRRETWRRNGMTCDESVGHEAPHACIVKPKPKWPTCFNQTESEILTGK